jgi:ubiquinone biosynthesis protein COQ4
MATGTVETTPPPDTRAEGSGAAGEVPQGRRPRSEASSATRAEGSGEPSAVVQRVQWRRAWKALRNLIRDPERTELVFALIQSLGGDNGDRNYQRFRSHPEGRQLLEDRPSLYGALCDVERLEQMPEGSLGRAYAAFMREGGLEAQGLVDASEKVREDDGPDPERRWYFDRTRDMHDLWHVLTGYGRDLAGEAANLAFTYGQLRTRGIGAIVLSAAWVGPKSVDLHWQRYLFRAWRRGRRAVPLSLVRYEELLDRPLDQVRRELHIQPPEAAHPGGVIVSGAES